MAIGACAGWNEGLTSLISVYIPYPTHHCVVSFFYRIKHGDSGSAFLQQFGQGAKRLHIQPQAQGTDFQFSHIAFFAE
ncbi:MAG TPA: hypothetical protein VN023_11455 [Methylovorus sp.]|nr:hypothetical protein [Methylovorus sp.]